MGLHTVCGRIIHGVSDEFSKEVVQLETESAGHQSQDLRRMRHACRRTQKLVLDLSDCGRAPRTGSHGKITGNPDAREDIFSPQFPPIPETAGTSCILGTFLSRKLNCVRSRGFTQDQYDFFCRLARIILSRIFPATMILSQAGLHLVRGSRSGS